MKESPLRIHAGGSSGSGTSLLVQRLREAPAPLHVTEAPAASPGELVDALTLADVALVVVEPVNGLTISARRQTILASLAGVERVVLALNKLDLANNAEDAFKRIDADFKSLARELGLADAVVVPTSALSGENIGERSPATPWYLGSTLMGALESAPSAAERLRKKPFRMPVRSAGASGVEGSIASGEVRAGDPVRLSSGRASRVNRILVSGKVVDHASVDEAVTLELADVSSVPPGELVSGANQPAEAADQFEASVVWLDQAPLLRGRDYVFEIGAKSVTATIGFLKYKINVSSLEHAPAQKFERDDIGVCNLRLDAPVAFDPHRENPRTGRFRLLDPVSGVTVGIGMLHFALRRAQNVHWQALDVNKASRSGIKGQRPCVLWYTGLSGAGKSTIANLVDKKLHAMSRHTYLLDGDNVRHGLNKDLGFTAADRVENIRRIAEVAKLMVDAGLIVGTAFISPFRAERSMARTLLGADEFIEIFVDTPLGVAEERDPKGLYKKARRGELKNFTGIDSPYEAPENPDLRIDTTSTTSEQAAEIVVAYLRDKGVLDAD